MTAFWKVKFQRDESSDFGAVLVVQTSDAAVKTDLEKPEGELAKCLPEPVETASHYPQFAHFKLAQMHACRASGDLEESLHGLAPTETIHISERDLPSLGTPIASRDGVKLWRVE